MIKGKYSQLEADLMLTLKSCRRISQQDLVMIQEPWLSQWPDIVDPTVQLNPSAEWLWLLDYSSHQPVNGEVSRL